MLIHGIDFTSAPRRAKPIAVATGAVSRANSVDVVTVTHIECLATFDAFEAWLQREGPWIGAFDFPFGLPRELVEHLGWPSSGRNVWARATQHIAQYSHAEIAAMFKQFCDAREPGNKFAHRTADGPAGSSPSMKWVNPPVAFMLRQGAPRLLEARVHLPGLHRGDVQRVALEGYPAHLARSITKSSYKSDDKSKQTAERATARKHIVATLTRGDHPLGIRLRTTRALKQTLVDDASGDLLDAALCAVQAAWAQLRRDRNFGLPKRIDPLEGWIASVPAR